MVNQLLKIARNSPHPLHRHATIVLKGGAVVATGYNHDGIHSEVVALSKLWPNKRRGCSIVNLRLRRDGSIGNSAPCPVCSKFLKLNGIRKVMVIQ